MFGENWAWLILTAILNVAVGFVFFRLFRAVSVRKVVAEKSQDVALGAQGEPSSSRVISFLGGTIMACFVWAVANVIVYRGITSPDHLDGFISSIGGFLLSGSALFLPYAVNRLTDVGKAATQGNVAETDKAALAARADEAKQEAAQQIDAALAQSSLTAEAAKSIVSDAIKTATATS